MIAQQITNQREWHWSVAFGMVSLLIPAGQIARKKNFKESAVIEEKNAYSHTGMRIKISPKKREKLKAEMISLFSDGINDSKLMYDILGEEGKLPVGATVHEPITRSNFNYMFKKIRGEHFPELSMTKEEKIIALLEKGDVHLKIISKVGCSIEHFNRVERSYRKRKNLLKG